MSSEMFGMEWHQIHTEAERLEHAISPAFEAKLIEKLGEEGDCPHGNKVLPKTPAQIKRRGLLSLSEATEGTDYVIASLYERDSSLLEFLHELGIGPKVAIHVQKRNDDNTMQLSTKNGSVTLGQSAAIRVWVRPSPGSRAADEPRRRKKR